MLSIRGRIAKNSVVKDGVRRGRKFRKEGMTDPSIVNTKPRGEREREKEAGRTVYNSQSRRRSQEEVHCKTGEKKEGIISLSMRSKRNACFCRCGGGGGKKRDKSVSSIVSRTVLRKEEDLGGEVGGRN